MVLSFQDFFFRAILQRLSGSAKSIDCRAIGLIACRRMLLREDAIL